MSLKKTKQKIHKKRTHIFSNQNRLRADTRMVSKGINTLYQGRIGSISTERYGVSENQVSLKKSLKAQLRTKFLSAVEISKQTKNPLKIISIFFRESNIGEYKNGPLTDEIVEKRDTGNIRITKKRGQYYKNRKGYRAALIHEFFHSTHIAPNNVGAHAFENYIENRLNKKRKKRTPKEIVDRAIALEIILKKFSKMKLGEYERVGKTSLASIGTELGEIASDIESQTRKRGAGLFFLKEVLNGRKAAFTISRISRGELDRKINNWVSMNPRLARML